jgi:acetylornithine deacetylase/succinyl-diaminopimelate desuccinylase-like protein
MLAADIILVSDTTMISESVPSINCGMRGLSYVEVKVTGPNKDLHSGHYGGAVANPINVLCDMISSLIDKDGHITVKGFYDDVVELSADDRAKLSRAPFDIEEETYGEWCRLLKEYVKPDLMICGHVHHAYITNVGDALDAFGQPCTVVVGSAPGSSNATVEGRVGVKGVFVGTGVELEAGGFNVKFVGNDSKEYMQTNIKI